MNEVIAPAISVVDERLAKAEQTSIVLADKLVYLTERLKMVMRSEGMPEIATPGVSGGSELKRDPSPLTKEIDSLQSRIEGHIARVEDILSRLEV